MKGSQPVSLTTQGEECHFPFTFNNHTYSECINDLNRPWCVTEKQKGKPVKYGYCLADWGKLHCIYYLMLFKISSEFLSKGFMQLEAKFLVNGIYTKEIVKKQRNIFSSNKSKSIK